MYYGRAPPVRAWLHVPLRSCITWCMHCHCYWLRTGATALKYGMTVAFETVYNDYITVSSEGRIRSGAYHGDNDNIKLVSPKGKKVHFGTC